MEYLQKQDGIGLKGSNVPKDYDPHTSEDTVEERWDRVAERQGNAGREEVPERGNEKPGSTGSSGLQSNIKRMLGM